MKILLVQPPVQDFYQTAVRTQPLGLAYLAASLRRHGHDVAVLDCQRPGLKRQISVPHDFSYMKAFYAAGDKSPFRLYGRYFHFGLSFNEIAEQVRGACPEAVGIACQCTPYVHETIRIAALVKKIDRHIPVIVGGAHASAAPETLLQSPAVDYVVIGEGETVLPRLIDCLEAGTSPEHLRGVGFKNRDSLQLHKAPAFIDDLDSIAFPARDLLDLSCYRMNGAPSTMLITSRGCPQACSYCSVHAVMGKRLRYRSPENILEEMRLCRDAYGITLFDIEDDNFTFDANRAFTILSLIADRFGDDGIQLVAMNGLAVISLNKKLLAAMRRAGFQHLDLSLGSSIGDVNKRMHRPSDLPKTDMVLHEAAQLGFPVTTYIILGVPGQTLAEMIDALLYAAQHSTAIGPSIFYPSPGTRIYEELCGQGFWQPDFLVLRSSAFPVQTGAFSRLDVVTLLRLARWINFVKHDLYRQGIAEIPFRALPEKADEGWLPDGFSRQAPAMHGTAARLTAQRPFTAEETGRLLSALLLRHKTFYGMKRMRRRGQQGCLYEIFPYATSAAVMQQFFEKAQHMTLKAARPKKG